MGIKMGQRQKLGFSLLEMMVVIAIVMVLGVILIPNMIRSKIVSNESAALVGCKTIANACNLYAGKQDFFPLSINDLTDYSPPYIDPKFADAVTTPIGGYNFSYSIAGTTSGTFSLYADPSSTLSGKRHFFVDETSVVRSCEGCSQASKTDPPVG